MTTLARLSPPDRRAPNHVAAGQCPQGRECGCCPADHRRRDRQGRLVGCREPHPPADRDCRLPYPAQIHACPERESLPAVAGSGACCVECGRVTSRRHTDGLPWCAGTSTIPAFTPPAA